MKNKTDRRARAERVARALVGESNPARLADALVDFAEEERMTDFQRELAGVINRFSKEATRRGICNGSNTPDLILAEYLLACLYAFDAATNQREGSG